MTRLHAEANYQYVPLAAELISLIASYVAPAPETARMVDICAGTGEAAGGMAATWNIGRERLYLNELVEGRAAQCRNVSEHVLGADAIRALQASVGSFQVAWTNPPFGQQPKEQGGGRLEPLFFKRIVEDGRWLQPGGVHLMLAPQDVWLTNRATLNHLARCYDQLTLVALPTEQRRYREVLMIGVVRSHDRHGAELQTRAKEIALKLIGELPTLTEQEMPRYTIPVPLKQQKAFIWRDANAATPEQAQADVLASGGAWVSRSHRARLGAARQDRRRIRPIFPLGKVAAALRVAEGDINNMRLTIAGRSVRLKGSTRTSTKTWQEQRATSEGNTVIDTHRMELREPVVVTMDTETAAITRYTGDTGIATLMDIPDAAHSLLDAVAQSAPPVYDMHIPPEVANIVNGIVSVSGRALPGYAPGYIPMQQHIIAAAYVAFRDADPHTGKRRKVLGLGADMGCGKSSLAAGTAEVLRTLLPTNQGRAATVLVVAPNHLIGELAQVLAHDQAPQTNTGERPPLPQWIGEWRDLLPHWHSTILETPAQVSAFYAGAQADKATPRVGFIAFSKFSLGSGWDVAVTTHCPAPPASSVNPDDTDTAQGLDSARAQFYERLRAEERREWEAWKQRTKAAKRRQRDRQAQRVAAANDERTTTLSYGAGVSERTQRRDHVLRCGTAYRESLKGGEPTPTWHYDGVFCPDCGRRVLGKDGTPHTTESLRRVGLVRCVFCGGVLGQWSRKQDNVSDRALPIFNDPTYLCGGTPNGRRSIPWGARPTSNPRIALGDFIVARGYAAQTDLVITDEFHAMKGRASARGRIWGRLLRHAHRSIGLTGSPYGGKASTAYWMLQRMNNTFVREQFQWDEERAFVERLGVLDTISSEVVEEQAFSGKRTAAYVRVEERSGLTAELAAMMQSQFIFILLKQMGFVLPPYHEGVVFFDLPGGLAEEYQRLVSRGKQIIKQPGGKDALSSYLQSTLTYALAPWKPVTVQSKRLHQAYCPPAFAADTVLPHHQWLAKCAAEQASAGRGMLIFAEHTNKLDILADLQTKIQNIALAQHGTPVNVAILRSTTVKLGARGAWFAERERDGTNVVLCHPGLVETGMNLIAWPEIVFAEPTYSLYRAMQARRRALRPTQTRPCNVTWLGYRSTMIEQALDIIGSKATAATLLQELAKRVLNDEEVRPSAIAAQFSAAGEALKAAMEVGATDLVGIGGTALARPDLSRFPARAPAEVPASPLAFARAVSIDAADSHVLNGEVLSWREVLVRAKRKEGRMLHADHHEPHTVQLSFLTD